MSWHLFVTVVAYASSSQRHLAELGPDADSTLADRDADNTEAGKQWSQRQNVAPHNEQSRIGAAAGVRFQKHRRLLDADLGNPTGDDAGNPGPEATGYQSVMTTSRSELQVTDIGCS